MKNKDSVDIGAFIGLAGAIIMIIYMAFFH